MCDVPGATEREEYQFDFERLDVYQRALQLTGAVFQTTRALSREYQFSVADQLRRSSLSVLNNIAEGSGKRSKKEKVRFYRTALDSLRECVPMLTLLRTDQQMEPDAYRRFRREVVHIGNMLGKLIASVG